MKKFFALVLAFALVMSLGVVAFAAEDADSPEDVKSPVAPSGGGSGVDLGWGQFTTRIVAAKKGMDLIGADGKVVATVENKDVVQLAVGEADKLAPEDKDAFLAAYEEAKAVEGKVVKYFYWIDIPESFKANDFAWVKFEFKCAGENVEVTVNGHPMEVVHVEGVDYYAKLTEFGAVAILCD